MALSRLMNRWFIKYFSDPEGVILALLLILGFAVVIFMGEMLAAVFASIIIAYLLEGLVKMLERTGLPRLPAVLLVFVPALFCLLFLLFGLLPLLLQQLTELVAQLPGMILSGQQLLLRLPEEYPDFISEEQIHNLMRQMGASAALFGQTLVTHSAATIGSVVTFIIYLVVFPVLVFFFLKDKELIFAWIGRYMPRERGLTTRVWQEMELQIGNYVRGKFLEILIVAVFSVVVFAILGLNFAVLLGALVGVSCLIPYIGAIVMTFPIAIIAYFQWGMGSELLYVLIAYAVIQALDANVLVPILFSETVNLHPVAIIVAVLVFGGLWGFWGVFFSIPLATLVKAVMDAWPRALEEAGEESARRPP